MSPRLLGLTMSSFKADNGVSSASGGQPGGAILRQPSGQDFLLGGLHIVFEAMQLDGLLFEVVGDVGGAGGAVLQSRGRISGAKFQRFRAMAGVKSLCYMYETEQSSDPFAVSDGFSVQLGVGTTPAQLEALADQYGCTVRLWGPTDAHDVYFVTVPKSVSMGVVRLSAVFQETHLFGWTSPNFVIFGGLDV